MLETKRLMVTIDFHTEKKNTLEVDGYYHCLVNSILQNIFVCKQKKESHTGLGQVEGEVYNDRIEIFGWTVPLILCMDHQPPL